jgi:hypothetical protein
MIHGPVLGVSRAIAPKGCIGLWVLLSLGGTAAAQSTSFLLVPGRAGTLEIGVPVDTVLREFGPNHVRLVDLQLEGHFSPAVEINLGDSGAVPGLVARISQFPCYEFAVSGISVYDQRFRTREGIGVGSTIGELRRTYDVRLNREEGHSAIVPSLKMTFAIDGTSFADSIRVTSVWMWSDPNEVRQRRCPNARR